MLKSTSASAHPNACAPLSLSAPLSVSRNAKIGSSMYAHVHYIQVCMHMYIILSLSLSLTAKVCSSMKVHVHYITESNARTGNIDASCNLRLVCNIIRLSMTTKLRSPQRTLIVSVRRIFARRGFSTRCGNNLGLDHCTLSVPLRPELRRHLLTEILTFASFGTRP